MRSQGAYFKMRPLFFGRLKRPFSKSKEENDIVIRDALRRCAKNYSNRLAMKDEYGKHFPQSSSCLPRIVETVNRLQCLLS
jgi:hypothetical protein